MAQWPKISCSNSAVSLEIPTNQSDDIEAAAYRTPEHRDMCGPDIKMKTSWHVPVLRSWQHTHKCCLFMKLFSIQDG